MLSPDPHTWEGSAIAANGSVIAGERGGLLYYYQAGEPNQIGLARSTNGHRGSATAHPC